MLRFINSNRMAAVGLAAAIVLVIVTMFGRFGSRTGTPDQTDQPSAGPLVTAEAAREPTHDSAAAPGTTPIDIDPDPARLAVPVDPSGARGARTQAGAHQSAIDFAGTVQQRMLYLTKDAARRLLTSWSAESADLSDLDADIDGVATLRSTLTSGGGNLWWSVTPIASHLDAFDTDRARVSVWIVQVFGSDVDPQLGGNAVAPTVAFHTSTVDLVWNDTGGWSVWATSSAPGPVPMMSPGSTMSAPIEFMDALGDFTLTKEHS